MKYKKLCVWLLSLLPLSVLIYLAARGELGPDPGKELTGYLGHISVSFILLVLSLPLLKKLKPLHWLGRCSRLLGLFTFFYVSLHLFSYSAFFVGFRFDLLTADLLERPYVYVGFSAWLVLMLLAITSNRFSQRQLKRHWKRLHKGVYLATALMLVHVYWLARSDLQWFVLYGVLFLALVAAKTWVFLIEKRTK